MQSTNDASQTARSVLKAVGEGELTPTEGATHIMGLVYNCRRIIELIDSETRLQALESNLARSAWKAGPYQE